MLTDACCVGTIVPLVRLPGDLAVISAIMTGQTSMASPPLRLSCGTSACYWAKWVLGAVRRDAGWWQSLFDSSWKHGSQDQVSLGEKRLAKAVHIL